MMNNDAGFRIDSSASDDGALDVLCFSHLRWRFVYQRPQHLLTRVAALRSRVYYFEEPIYEEARQPELRMHVESSSVRVVTPVMPFGFRPEQSVAAQRELIAGFLSQEKIRDFIAWYYTPMALEYTADLDPHVTVYDCMDELSAFRGAPARMVEFERQLLQQADVVFTGGRSLYEAKRSQHRNIHAFPSSVDVNHFAVARAASADPADQAMIPHPRIGFFGVLDERLDRDLLREIATCEPGWQFILIGPVVKISQENLPQAANIHYLGAKQYSELPTYLSGWDVAMLPFARNESTRFISPTKTPEYLAAGRPVVSTPITDVVEPYQQLGLVEIAETPVEFCAAIAKLLNQPDKDWQTKVDDFLSKTSWDKTFQGMWEEVLRASRSISKSSEEEGSSRCLTT